MKKYIGEIQQHDVGRSYMTLEGGVCSECGTPKPKVAMLGMGILQQQDVGKRVYKVKTNDPFDGAVFYQMENNEQRDNRFRKEGRYHDLHGEASSDLI